TGHVRGALEQPGNGRRPCAIHGASITPAVPGAHTLRPGAGTSTGRPWRVERSAVMELLHRVRASTARAASRLGREPDTKRRWARRARALLYVVVTALLALELHISQEDNLPPALTAVQVAAVLVL